MISIMETFFADYFNFGEKTNKLKFSVSDEESGVTSEINKDNILVRDEGIGTSKNNYESDR